jgi:hypothetical protein
MESFKMNKKQVYELLKTNQYALYHNYVLTPERFYIVKLKNPDDLAISLIMDGIYNGKHEPVNTEYQTAVKLTAPTFNAVKKLLSENGGYLTLRNKNAYLSQYVVSASILEVL